jgi:transposase
MVAEMEAPGASASAVSRRYDVNTNLLFKWRREIAAMDDASGTELVALGVVDRDGGLRLMPDATDAMAEVADREPSIPARNSGKMEIALADGTVVRVDNTVDERALGRVLATLRRYR